MAAISSNDQCSQWQRVRALKTMASVVMFLRTNGIKDVESLAVTVSRMHERQYEVAGSLGKLRRRTDTLVMHLVLYEEFYKLRGDVKNVEVLRRSAERIMGEATQERRAPARGHDMAL